MSYEDLIGIPFKDGGRDKTGMDCWGLARECFKRQGIYVKDYSVSAMEESKISEKMEKEHSQWKKLEEPVEGCLVLIRTEPKLWANHVGIYIGNGRFIHAYMMAGVCVSTIKRWSSHIVGYYYPRE